MSKWSDPNKFEWFYGDWCKKCWIEFTTLTEQEQKNLEERARLFNKKNGKYNLLT